MQWLANDIVVDSTITDLVNRKVQLTIAECMSTLDMVIALEKVYFSGG